jgi:hypothetical protein
MWERSGHSRSPGSPRDVFKEFELTRANASALKDTPNEFYVAAIEPVREVHQA